MPAICNMCQKVFSSNSVRNRHVKEVHGQSLQSVGYENPGSYCCLGEDCNNSFSTNKTLMEHLQTVHYKEFQIQSLLVENWSGFEKWKLEIEQANNSSYVLKSKHSSTAGEIVYYNCNRSKTSVVAKNREEMSRLQKSQGSCKMKNSCTSQIKVRKENDKFVVEWQKVHYGHTVELQHIGLQIQEKQHIASKLISGVTARKILESTRDNIGEHSKRIDLLTSKDLRNIKTSYGLEIKDGMRNQNDAFSVDLWVQECKDLEENPVLFYKPQGVKHESLENEDFCLIIMNMSQRQHVFSTLMCNQPLS